MNLSRNWVFGGFLLASVGLFIEKDFGPLFWMSIFLYGLIILSTWQRDESRYRIRNFYLLEDLKDKKLPIFREKKQIFLSQLEELKEAKNVRVWAGYEWKFRRLGDEERIKNDIKILEKELRKNWFLSEDRKTRKKITLLREEVVSALDFFRMTERRLKNFEKIKAKWARAKKFIPLKVKEIENIGVPEIFDDRFKKLRRDWAEIKTEIKKNGLDFSGWSGARYIIRSFNIVRKEIDFRIKVASWSKEESQKLLEELKRGIEVIMLAEKNMDADDPLKPSITRIRRSFQAIIKKSQERNMDWTDLYSSLLHSVSSYRGMIEKAVIYLASRTS
jgi:hypothetical protein